MRLVKILLTVLAVAALFAGIIAAAVLALTGVAAVLLGRLLRLPRFQRTPRARRTDTVRGGDVIDVTATEVRSERLPR